MLNYNPVTKEKGECVVVGRAAVGIYLALNEIKNSEKQGRNKVLYPANICYTAVLPAVYLGLEIVFADVDKMSGLVTVETITDKLDDHFLAAVVPHMYGNPVPEIAEIASLCSKKNVSLIEDCASLMGQSGGVNKPGFYGDYAIYSTGYAKTISLGFGGLVFSAKHSLSAIENFEKTLGLESADADDYWGDFSRNYRKYRTEGQCSLEAQTYFENMLKTSFENIIFSISDDKRQQILDALVPLSEVIEQRREDYKKYGEMLADTAFTKYSLNEDAVPWRYSFFVDDRPSFVKYCLDNHLPISDWYPVVAPLFGDCSSYPSAAWHETRIVNFPLLVGEEEITRICDTIKRY